MDKVEIPNFFPTYERYAKQSFSILVISIEKSKKQSSTYDKPKPLD